MLQRTERKGLETGQRIQGWNGTNEDTLGVGHRGVAVRRQPQELEKSRRGTEVPAVALCRPTEGLSPGSRGVWSIKVASARGRLWPEMTVASKVNKDVQRRAAVNPS